MRIVAIILTLTVAGYCCTAVKTEGIKAYGLRCEYSENPLGIENDFPRLSWLLGSNERNQKQTAWQILVASDPEKLNNDEGDIWDSRRVNSGQSILVRYAGKKTLPCRRYYWKVRVWDKRQKRSAWSEQAYWETGLKDPDQWKAEWIGYTCENAPLFRKEFEITKPVKAARIYISTPGYYELSLNGSGIGDHVLDPAQTDYEQRTFYAVYDVTEKLIRGVNVAGVMLGNGWYDQTAVNNALYGWNDVVYGSPGMIFQLHLTYTDGSENMIISDGTWRACSGPVTSNNVYAGEQYDAGMEQTGWDKPGFDDRNWDSIRHVSGPGGRLVCQNIPPIKKIKTLRPVNITNPKPGVYVCDMGQNFAGWARLKLKAAAGTIIQLRFAECLDNIGMIDPRSTGYYATGLVQTDKYICKGNGDETWEPRFTYHGFRYVEMTGFPGVPGPETLTGIVVHTALVSTGDFECSDTMFNRLHQTALWTEKSNLYGLPTDCPHRERCGWLGDAFLTSDMTMYNFGSATFWSKFTGDIETSRRGGIPTDIAPGKRTGGKDPDWGAAFIQLPWNLYLYYGDSAAVTSHYEGMVYFMDHLRKISSDGIIYAGIGSLFSPGRIMPYKTPVEFTSTALYYFCAGIMARMACITGKGQEGEKYASLARKIKYSFNNKFYNKQGKTYGCQEKNTLALALGLVPDNNDNEVAKDLNHDIIEIHDGHTDAGIFGNRYIYGVLGKYGYGETIKRMLNSVTFPSYGYLFVRGATTLWENWGEKRFADKNTTGDERSENHPFRGGFDAWFFNGIAGINPDPGCPGFRHIIFHPQLLNVLDSAGATFNSVYGLIASKWRNSADGFSWSVTIPVNTTATVCIPADDPESVYEGNVVATQSAGIKFLGIENGCSMFETGSGEYLFNVNRKSKPRK